MVVDIEKTDEAIEPTVEIVPAIVNALEKENITKELILAKAVEYGAITIAGIDDRDGLTFAKQARRSLVSTRTLIEETRYNLNKDAMLLQRRNNAVAKELTAMIEAIEEPIDKQIKAIELEIDERRKARENEKAQRIATRTNSLIQLGATFDGVTYYINGFAVDAVEVIASPDEEFAELLQQATIARDAYVQEQARIAQEQFNESERLRLQKEEQDREAKRQEEERKNLAKMKLETRIGALAAVGMPHFERTGQSYLKLESVNTVFALTDNEILALSVEAFGDYLTLVKTKKAESDELDEKARQKQIQEKADFDRIQALFQHRSNKLIEVGFVLDKATETLSDSTGHFSLYTKEEVVNLSDEEFDQSIIGINKSIVDRENKRIADQKAQDKAKADADKLRLKADRERAARIKPEVKDFVGFLKVFNNDSDLGYKQPEVSELSKRFFAEINRVVSQFTDEAKAL